MQIQNSIRQLADKIQNFSSKVKIFITFGFLLSFLVFAFCALSLSNVFAQTPSGLDLTISPPVFDLTAKPGDKITEKFRVRNNLNEKVDLEIGVRRLISDPQSGNPTPETDEKGDELKWISTDPQSFTALPREWKDINFTIDIPENAAYGYYFVLRITPKGEEKQQVTGASIKGELLVVILLNVKKEGAVSKAELIKFAPKNFINEYLPVEFEVKVKNQGNVHVKPRGNIFISREGKKEIAIIDVNPGIGSILPQGIRTFNSDFADGFIVKEPILEDGEIKRDKDGKPVTKLVINWNKLTSFRIGPYTAQLLLVYDDGKRDLTLESSTTFWVIPYTVLGILGISLIVLFIIAKYLLGWYVRRAIRNSRK